MLRNYLAIAVRTLRKQTLYAGINVLGLSVGMAACLLIGGYVQHELRYDRFHAESDRVARLVRERSAMSAAPIGPALQRDLPTVETSVRLLMDEDVIAHTGGPDRLESDLLFADTTFFDVFSFDLVRGRPETALQRPDGIVMTESAARRYFGTTDVVGETLIIEAEETMPFTVTAVMADVPATSHFQFDLVGSFLFVEQFAGRMENWQTNWLHTYLLLKENAQPDQVEAALPAFFERHTGEAWANWGVQPLLDVRLHSAHLSYDVAPQGNILYIYIFGSAALLILLIAGVNFVNLATARSVRRAREVGVRKALGAHPRQLIGQFLGESVLLALCAVGLAVGLAWLAYPVFVDVTGITPHISWSDGARAGGLLLLGGLGIGLVAGLYPAVVLTRFQARETLRGRVDVGRGGALRKGLIVTQFVISIGLITGTLVIREQLAFVQDAALGFEDEQVVVLPVGDEAQLDVRGSALTQALAQHPNVERVSLAGSVPGRPVSDFLYRPEGMAEDRDQKPGWDTFFVDMHFVETLGMTVAQGRSFDPNRASDSTAFVLNQSAVDWAVTNVGPAWQNPIGKRLDFYLPGAEGWAVDKTGPVIGVVEDFHYLSMRTAIQPVVLQVFPGTFDQVLVRIGPDDMAGTLAHLEAQWAAFGVERPFTYTFLDERFDQLYRSEQQVATLFTYFAGLAIFIACLGLFGLAAYMVEQRTKEVGVRKVLGASMASIVALVSADFLKLVGIAFAIAAPLAYWGMHEWLADFAYRVEPGPWVFIGAGGLALLVALLTVSVQAMRAARTDPAHVLRTE
jgi:putative ABC transport system permease protein